MKYEYCPITRSASSIAAKFLTENNIQKNYKERWTKNTEKERSSLNLLNLCNMNGVTILVRLTGTRSVIIADYLHANSSLKQGIWIEPNAKCFDWYIYISPSQKWSQVGWAIRGGLRRESPLIDGNLPCLTLGIIFGTRPT